MGILDALAGGFLEAISLQVLPYLLAGALFGLFLGVIPGLSGHFAMAMTIPFLYSLSPDAGIAFLLGSHSTVAQGGGLTAILFNTPGCGQNAATLLDGPAMRDRGQAGKAAGAAMTACFLGAAFGVLVLAALLPVLQHVVLLFGPAEIFMLVLLALTFIAVLGKEDIGRSLIAGLAGLFLATIGVEHVTNQQRYTFDLLALHDGLPLVPVILGLFACAEMVELWVRGRSMAGEQDRPPLPRETQRQIFQGVRAVFSRWWLVLRCSAIGTVMGVIPGLGSTAAGFVAYGHARQTSKTGETFGAGNIEGVISAESANDAVEGGALASTLAFGIPGSSSMAIVLAGLIVLGLHTGPEIVTHNADLVFVMIFTILIGNLFGTVTGMFLVNPLSRLTFLPTSLLVPVLLSVICTGAFAVNRSLFDIGIVIVFGALGYLMKRLGYSRAALLIGFVLGGEIEKNLFLAVQIDGPLFFLRPVPLVIAAITLGMLIFSVRAILRDRGQVGAPPGTGDGQSGAGATVEQPPDSSHQLELYVISGAVLIFIGALVAALGYHRIPAHTPIVILVPLVALAGFQLNRIRRARRMVDSPGPSVLRDVGLRKAAGFMAWTVLLLGLIVVAGHYAGIGVFMFLLLRRASPRDGSFALAVAASATLALFILFEFGFDIELYRGLLFRVLTGFRTT